MSAQSMRAVIETNRLTLRRMTAQDCGRVVELLNDWAVASMLGRVAHPYSPDDYFAWQSGHDAAWAHATDFPYAICTAREGLIGCVGLDGGHTDAPTYELGYWLGQAYWGQGYATEAARAVLAYGLETKAYSGFSSSHFDDNPASRRVLQKLGFEAAGIGTIWSEARHEAVGAQWLWLSLERAMELHGVRAPVASAPPRRWSALLERLPRLGS